MYMINDAFTKSQSLKPAYYKIDYTVKADLTIF